jgi:hypothetical protein
MGFADQNKLNVGNTQRKPDEGQKHTDEKEKRDNNIVVPC